MSKDLHTLSRTSRPNSLKCKQRGQSNLVTKVPSPRVPSVSIDPPALSKEQCSSTKVDSFSHLSPVVTRQFIKSHVPLSHTNRSTDSLDSGYAQSQQSSKSSLLSDCTSQEVSGSDLAGEQHKYHTNSYGDNSPDEEKPLLISDIRDDVFRVNSLDDFSRNIVQPTEGFSPRRVSITTDALADLMTAAMRVIDDVQSEPNLLESEKEKIEVDGPYRRKSSTWSGDSHHSSSSHLLGSRRLSAGNRGSALDHVPVQRRRSAQPYFHSFLHSREDDEQPASRNPSRKTSGCIICDRKHEQSFSAPSVIIKTSMSTKSRQRRRFSEALLVWTKSACDLPYVELHVPRIDELVILRTQPRQRPTRSLPQPAREEKIKKSVNDNLPQFIRYTNWTDMVSHLVSKRLLSDNSRQRLMSATLTDRERGNYFYMDVLPTQGDNAYSTFYECLKNEQEHNGHTDLLKMLDAAIAANR